MSDIGGVTVTTSVSVEVTDYVALGRFIAEATGEDQVKFLAGVATGFQSFAEGTSRFLALMQMEYIREAVATHNERAEICWLVREMDARLNPEGGRP